MDGYRLSRGEEHLSLAQLFTIGVGPSSSHTGGPMRAGRLFLEQISNRLAHLTRLATVLGGANLQIENAAEIGMKHSLGLTCDPVGGLVQIPHIERNTVGAIKAISAAHLAMHGNGEHHVSLDAVIETMRQTGTT